MKSERTASAQSELLRRDVMLSFPKVELHRHLEGTFHLPTLLTIAQRNGLPVPQTLEEFRPTVQFPKDSDPDFLKFLSFFKNDWYRTLDDVEQIAYHSVKQFADDGILFIELRFSPEHFAFHNGFDRAEVTKLVISSANQAAKEAGFGIKYLITFNRGKQEQPEMLKLYQMLRSLGHDEIVGIDLAGDETNFGPELFSDFFAQVNKDGVYKTTVHAGEVSPSSQIWDAIKLLNADRIGHGVSTINDEELQAYLRDHNIALEQCITSNYQTGSWSDEASHPIGRLHRADVPVTINSDDPTIQDAALSDDYIKAVRYFDFTVDDLVALNLRAIDTAFLSDDERRTLRVDYQKAVAEFRSAHKL